MRARKRLLLGAVLVLGTAGCDREAARERPPVTPTPAASPSESASAGDYLPQSLRTIFDSSGKVIGEAGSLSQEELKKLRQFEYRVITLDSGAADTAIETQLNELGKEGWECTTHVGGESAQLKVVCKRRPATPLRYVPQTLLGR